MNYEELAKLAEASGFTAWVPLDIATIELKPEVRDMCKDNTCGRYDRCWSCPPGCGDLEECAGRLKPFTGGILVQTSGEVEDSYDFEAMMEIDETHKANFEKMYAELRRRGIPVLALGAGCCTRCEKCTYPDAPCRFPDQMVSSMEAYGMLVLDVCKKNNLQYYYGSDHMAYTSCFLV